MRYSNYQSQTCRKDNVNIPVVGTYTYLFTSLSLSSLSQQRKNKLLFHRKLLFSDIHVCIYLLSSRYDVSESNKTENEVTVSEEATKVDRKRSFDYNFEYNNKASSLFLDITQLDITYAGMIGFFSFSIIKRACWKYSGKSLTGPSVFTCMVQTICA